MATRRGGKEISILVSIPIGDVNPHPYYGDKNDFSSLSHKEKCTPHPLLILVEKNSFLVPARKNLLFIPSSIM